MGRFARHRFRRELKGAGGARVGQINRHNDGDPERYTQDGQPHQERMAEQVAQA